MRPTPPGRSKAPRRLLLAVGLRARSAGCCQLSYRLLTHSRHAVRRVTMLGVRLIAGPCATLECEAGEMAAEERDPGEPPVHPVLGQPRMVADPRISIAQAADVLGKTPQQVYRLIKLGRLHRRGEPGKFWGLLLSDVVRLRDKGEPLKLAQAAPRLGCSIAEVRELIADGKLPLVPGAKSLVYPSDVLATAKTLAKRRVGRPEAVAGQIDTAAVARRLGLSDSRVRQMAAAGKLPAMFVDRQWWYDSTRIDMIERVRRAQALRAVPIYRMR
jgi:hypothetical protein